MHKYTLITTRGHYFKLLQFWRSVMATALVVKKVWTVKQFSTTNTINVILIIRYRRIWSHCVATKRFILHSSVLH